MAVVVWGFNGTKPPYISGPTVSTVLGKQITSCSSSDQIFVTGLAWHCLIDAAVLLLQTFTPHQRAHATVTGKLLRRIKLISCMLDAMPSVQTPNRTLQILRAAEQDGYAVLAAIAYNVEHITALVRAAEASRSPLILLLFPSTLKQLPSLVFAASAACKAAKVPISLHLDHAQDEVQIRHVIEHMPFDSIMIDMSHWSHAENLRKTRELTLLCHEKGIAVEAESGRINGSEDGIGGTGDLEEMLTTPEEMEEFLSADVDIIAPCIGNVHGDYPPAGPKLEIDRLRQLHKVLQGRASIALHGTNDFSPELTQECIRSGVTKFNVNKLLLESWNRFAKDKCDLSVTAMIDRGIDIVQKETEKWMAVCGSVNRAVLE